MHQIAGCCICNIKFFLGVIRKHSQCSDVYNSVEIPGPIDNQKLMVSLLNKHVPSIDYAQLSPAMWHFLYDTYGGGPAIELPLTEDNSH